MILLVAIVLVLFAAWLRRRLSVDNPTPAQHLVEVVFEAIQNLMKEVIGPESRRFTPLIGTLGIYILVGNILGMVPGFISPTSNLNVTASCALTVFVYYNYHGIRKHGFANYMKHFGGPVIWMAPFLFLIEIVSHLARREGDRLMRAELDVLRTTANIEVIDAPAARTKTQAPPGT